MIELEYKDTVTIVDTFIDGYGTERAQVQAVVSALFFENTGWSSGGNQIAVESDAGVFVNHKDTFILANHDRLEGMLIIANNLGGSEDEAWYRIIDVVVGQDKLLGNDVYQVILLLKKSTEIPPYVS